MIVDLEERDGYIICPHCLIPLTKLDRPHWYTPPVTVPAKAPPESHVNQLRAPFVPFTGLDAPSDADMSDVQIQLTPLYRQPENWELDFVCRAPF